MTAGERGARERVSLGDDGDAEMRAALFPSGVIIEEGDDGVAFVGPEMLFGEEAGAEAAGAVENHFAVFCAGLLCDTVHDVEQLRARGSFIGERGQAAERMGDGEQGIEQREIGGAKRVRIESLPRGNS